MDDLGLPSQAALHRPVLQALRLLGGSAYFWEIEDEVAKQLRLTRAQLELPHPGVDGRTAFRYRCAWARTQLKKRGEVENPEPGIWSIVGSAQLVETVDLMEEQVPVSEPRLTPGGSGAWLLYTSKTRVHAGNEGYDDEVAVSYTWDDTVSHHADLREGDLVALWDGSQLLGISVISRITKGESRKPRFRCPMCSTTDLRKRQNMSPLYRCGRCREEFQVPDTETLSITTYRTNHAQAWVDLLGVADGKELRSICHSPKSQQSMRPLRKEELKNLLERKSRGESFQFVAEVQRTIRGGHGQAAVVVGLEPVKGEVEPELPGSDHVAALDSDSYWQGSPDGTEPRSLEAVGAHLVARLPGRRPGSRLFNDVAVEALVRRLGLDGRPESTLEDAGELVGLTRERVRQLQATYMTQTENPAHVECVPLPRLLGQAFDITLGDPAAGTDLGRMLQDRGLTSHDNWTPDHLALLARLSGSRTIGATLQDAASERLQVERDQSLLQRLLPKAVWQASKKSGFCHTSACIGQLAELWEEEGASSALPEQHTIRREILGHASVLELPLGYLYSTGSGNLVRHAGATGARIISQTLLMLGVSSPLPISDLRRGLIRYTKFTQVPLDLPSPVLRAFFDWHPDFQVDPDGLVSPTADPGKPEGLMGWIIQKMRISDYGFLTHSETIALSRREKKNSNSLGIYLLYGVQIRHDRRGFYFPVGEPPAEYLVDQGLRAAGLAAVRTQQKWSFDADDRVVTLDLEVGTASLNGVVSVPSADRAYLHLLGEGRFPIVDPHGERHGNLSVSSAMVAVFGLQTYFSHKSVEPGDDVTIRIDLDAQIAEADI
jgi:ribosomal protein L37AE/L43A